MTTIGRYELVEEIGRGGMARVYRGHDPRINRQVAIKIMSGELLTDPVLRARFEREAQTIARLEHPSIVPIYDFGEDRNRLYLVMRLMGGGTLTDRLKKGSLPISETVKILQRIGSALERAHHEGIIHRDLKPSNIMFDDYGEAFLADFGIARLTASATTLTGEAAIGTPAYMSPEQIHGDRDLDHRSDIYALGVVCFEMLTGKKPFDDKTAAKLMMRHIIDPIPDIRKVNQDLPAGVEQVIARTMAKSPDERYSTASELVDTLDMLARGGELVLPKPSPESPPADRDQLAAPPSPAEEAFPTTEIAPAPSPGDEQMETEVMRPAFPTPPPTAPAGTEMATPVPSVEHTGEAVGEVPGRGRLRLPLIVGGGLLGLLLIAAIAAGAFFIFGRDEGDDDGPGAEVAVQETTTAVATAAEETDTPRPTITPSVEDTSQIQEEVDRLLEQSSALWDDGNLEEALSRIEQAIALQPEEAYLHHERAGLLRDLGRFDEALEEASTAVELAPEEPDFLVRRGVVLREMGRLDEALDNNQAAVRMDPGYAYAHLELGLTYRELGDYDMALDELSRAIDENPDAADLYGERANVLRDKGEIETAMRDLDRAISLNPDDPWFYEQLGEIHLWDIGDPAAAIEFYDRALELRPETAWVYTARAIAFRMQGRLGPALEDHNRAIELDPEYDWFYLERAVTYRQGGDYDATLADLERAISLNPEQGNHYHERAVTYFWNLGDFESAEADMMRAIELEPENHSFYHTLAQMYRDLGRFDEALEYFNRAAELGPWEAWIFIDRGYMFRDALDNVDAALADFNQAIEANPDNARAYQALATTLAWHLDDLEGGLEQTRRCSEVDPNQAWCYVEAGWILDALGNRSEARDAFERFLELIPADDCPECQEEVRNYLNESAPQAQPAEVPTMSIVINRACGETVQAQSNHILQISYGMWGTANEEAAQLNAQHLGVDLLLDGVPQRWQRQPTMPVPELPGCDGGPRNTGDPSQYGFFFISRVGPLEPGTYPLEIVYRLDAEVTDGYDGNGDGELDLYGPGEVGRQSFTLAVN